jgi:hypothetical protein
MVYARYFGDRLAEDIYIDVCKTLLPLSRSIVGDDLLNLFLMFERFGIHDDARQLMLNVSPNLMTIEQK